MDVPGFALVTGAASGIGRACARTFARDGCAGLALLDLNHEALIAVEVEIRNIKNRQSHKPCQVQLFAVDVTDEQQVNQAVADAAAKFGRLDYVVNAAGIGFKHEGGAAYAETRDWQRVLDINLSGTFFVLRAAVRVMLQQEHILSSIDGRPLQRGSIVNIGSILSGVGVPLSTAYTAAKHGVLGLTRTASEDYAKDGVRINVVCPGYTETPLTMDSPIVLEAMLEKVETAVPLHRMGKPEEIADAVVYLSGGRSSFVAGTALYVDGGYTSR